MFYFCKLYPHVNLSLFNFCRVRDLFWDVLNKTNWINILFETEIGIGIEVCTENVYRFCLMCTKPICIALCTYQKYTWLKPRKHFEAKFVHIMQNLKSTQGYSRVTFSCKIWKVHKAKSLVTFLDKIWKDYKPCHIFMHNLKSTQGSHYAKF